MEELNKFKGLLVAIEGIDGSGKTTLAKNLVNRLQGKGYKVHYTFEPTHSIIGKLLRELPDNYRSPLIETLLYAADRVHHYLSEIKTKIDEGYIVIVDRYIHSSIAYQGALGAPLQWIIEVNRHVPKPDLAFYIDVPVEVAIQRLEASRKKKTFYEKKELLRKVRRIYLELVDKGELILLNGLEKPEEITRKAYNKILSFLGSRAK